MASFNIANSKGRDAVVYAQGIRKKAVVRWVDDGGRQAAGIRVIKGDCGHDLTKLETQATSGEGIASLLIQSDPELDIERFGRFLTNSSRVYLNPEGVPVSKITQVEVVRNPDGTERERRPKKQTPQNTNVADEPIRLSGRMMKKSEVYNRFVFTNKRQLIHVNGLTYDFLYAIAKELEEADSLMIVGSGPRGVNPIIFSRGGSSYRGFLEGRTDGERYCLLLHLSNMELKAPPKPEESE